MLNDPERKLLRILSNFSMQHKRLPNMGELENKTGKRSRDIAQSLKELEKHNYISWRDKSSLDTIVLLEAWERRATSNKTELSSSSTDYWTAY